MNVFLAGEGHDTNSGPEGVTAIGQWSKINGNTIFAIGNGTSNTNRKNAFEVTSDGGIVLLDSNKNRWKITVNTNGELISTQLS